MTNATKSSILNIHLWSKILRVEGGNPHGVWGWPRLNAEGAIRNAVVCINFYNSRANLRASLTSDDLSGVSSLINEPILDFETV